MLIIALPATRSWPKHLVHWQHTTTLIVAIATPLLQPPRRTEQRSPWQQCHANRNGRLWLPHSCNTNAGNTTRNR